MILLLGPPLISQDVFGYLAFARMGALHGLDPYTHVAAEAPTDPIFVRRMAVPALPLRAAVHARKLRDRAAGARRRTVGAQGGRGAGSLGAVALIARAAGRARWVARCARCFVGLNPVLLELAVGGAHNDTLVLGFLAVALAAHRRSRPALRAGALALAAGVGIK